MKSNGRKAYSVGSLLRAGHRSVWRVWLIVLYFVLGAFACEVSSQVRFDPETFLLLRPSLDGTLLDVDIVAYRYQDATYLALLDVVDALEFPITVDADNGTASGWFIEAERDFALDLERAEITIAEKSNPLGEGDATVFEGELYVRATRLANWFPLEVKVDISKLQVNFVAKEALPIQARIERRQRVIGAVRPDLSRQSQFEPLVDPRSLLGPRSNDLRLTLSTSRAEQSASAQRRLQYSALSRGDLAFMDSSLFVGGQGDFEHESQSDWLNQARLNLSRSHMKQLPLAVHHVEIGDLLTGGSSDRGVLVRGGEVDQTIYGQYEFDTILLQGQQLPGWDVELYQNGTLIGFQTIGPDGRFEFPNVPLYYGENRFEYVYFGPTGEEEKEEFVHFVGPGMLKTGRFNYEIAVSQINRSLFNMAESTTSSVDDGALNIDSYLGVGLTRWLSGSLGAQSTQTMGKRVYSYESGMQAAVMNWLASFRYHYRPTETDSYSGLLQTRIGRTTRLRLEHTQYTNANQAERQSNQNAQRYRSELAVNSVLAGLPLNFRIDHTERYASHRTEMEFASTARLGRYRVSNTFNGVREASWSDDPIVSRSLDGSMGVYTRTKFWLFRSTVGYRLVPERRFKAVTTSADLSVSRDLSVNFENTWTLLDDRSRYSSALNWWLEQLVLSPRLAYDSDERFVGLLSVQFAFAPKPRRFGLVFDKSSLGSTGHVAARVFLDQNNDGVFGLDDKPLADVRVDAVQARRYATTGEKGQAMISRLPAYHTTDIAIDLGTLPGLDLTPAKPGYAITPRPGDWVKIDLPVIRTGSAEGYVRVRRADGSGADGIGRVVVRLIEAGTDERVARQRTAYDGYFYFEGIAPGRYRLTLDEIDQERIIEAPEPVVIRSDTGLITVSDFLLSVPPIQPGASGFAPPESDKTMPMQWQEDSMDWQQGSSNDRVPAEGAGIVPQQAKPSVQSGAAKTDAGALPRIDSPVQSGEAARKEVTAAPANDSLGTESGWYVQFGAYSSRENATALALEIRERLTDVLRPQYLEVRLVNRLYRVVTMPRVTEVRARDLCEMSVKRGVGCLVKRNNE